MDDKADEPQPWVGSDQDSCADDRPVSTESNLPPAANLSARERKGQWKQQERERKHRLTKHGKQVGRAGIAGAVMAGALAMTAGAAAAQLTEPKQQKDQQPMSSLVKPKPNDGSVIDAAADGLPADGVTGAEPPPPTTPPVPPPAEWPPPPTNPAPPGPTPTPPPAP